MNTDPTKTEGSVVVQDAPFQLKPLAQSSPWLKALFYGKHGAGKTELAGSAVDVPEMADVFMISAESGEKTLQNTTRIEHASEIMTVQASNFTQVGRVHEFLTAHCNARDNEFVTLKSGKITGTERLKQLESMVTGVPVSQIEKPKRFRTVILDSLTEIESYSMYGLLGVNIEQIVTGEVEVADWPIFRKNFEQVKLLCRGFRNLPMHVIFVCAQGYGQDEVKRYHYMPLLTGKLSTAVLGQVDVAGWLTVGSATPDKPAPRRLYVQPVSDPGIPRFEAKVRNGQVKQAYFEDPTMGDIIKALGLLK